MKKRVLAWWFREAERQAKAALKEAQEILNRAWAARDAAHESLRVVRKVLAALREEREVPSRAGKERR